MRAVKVLMDMVVQMYKVIELTLKDRVSIDIGATVELEVNENVEVPCVDAFFCGHYATLHIRKCHAKQGLTQLITTPFPEGFNDKPLVLVENRGVAPIELRNGENVASVWVYTY